MDSSAIESQIRSFILENHLMGEGESLDATDSFLERGILDSTGILEFVAFLEDTWKIEVDDADLVPDNLDSIERAARYVEGMIGE